MKVEDAEWEPHHRGKRSLSNSTMALRALKVSDVKRIVHDDVSCHTVNGHLSCSLANEILRLRRKLKWELDYYHEQAGILVVKRTK